MSVHPKRRRVLSGAAAAAMVLSFAAAPAVAMPDNEQPPGAPAPAPSIPVETPVHRRHRTARCPFPWTRSATASTGWTNTACGMRGKNPPARA
ncbi:hypothetical protein [Kocuria atrinae]|uniref:hypothetical protein n=1 Tax=Kocuria atrinae TaxID=592377 RepID=UPI001CB92E0F|nr:hypothetical protein [Kocuria atrinae]